MVPWILIAKITASELSHGGVERRTAALGFQLDPMQGQEIWKMGMAIGPATLAQRDETIAVWRRAGLIAPQNDPVVDFEFALGKPASDVLIGVIDGAIVASALVGHDGHRGWVYYLSVDPPHQRRQLGARMMAAVEDWLRSKGIWKINLMVRDSNVAVKGFYEAMGYETNAVTVFAKRL